MSRDFDWDNVKAAKNIRKHAISFEEAEEVFESPAIFEDFDHSESEPRYLAIGFSAKGRMLTVIFTRTGVGIYRIISARKATKQERQRYAETKAENN